MKALKFVPYLLLFVVFSCSSDSDSSSSDGEPFNLSLTDGNYWTYDVFGEAGTTRDSLYIANDTLISNKTYKKFKTENIPTGFYSSSLNNNGVRTENNKLFLSGTLDVGSNQGLPSNINIELEDFIIFDANASEGSNLDSQSGIIQENVNGYPISINYTLKSKAGSSFNEYTVDTEMYSNVKSTIISLEISVTTVYGGFTITALNNQEVLKSTQFIAENIGVIKTNSTFSYSMDPFIAGELGIPETETQNQEEILDTYSIN